MSHQTTERDGIDDVPDTANDSMVAMNGLGEIVIMGLDRRPALDKARALRLAAWIVAMVDVDDEFPALLAAIRAT